MVMQTTRDILFTLAGFKESRLNSLDSLGGLDAIFKVYFSKYNLVIGIFRSSYDNAIIWIAK